MSRQKQDLTGNYSKGKSTKSKTSTSTSTSSKKNTTKPLEVERIDVETDWKIEWNKQKYKPLHTTIANIQKYSICPLCREPFSKQDGNFYVFQSELYRNNEYYLPVCKSCIEELYEKLLGQLSTPHKAFRRICQLYDLYYCDALVESAISFSTPHKAVSYYLQKAKMRQFVGKTYAHTIVEEEEKIRITNAKDVSRLSQSEEDSEKIERLSAFWGFCFDTSDLSFLQAEYDDWASRYEITGKAMEELIKHLCMISLQIRIAFLKGETTNQLYKEYNAALDSANLKPKQNTDSILVETNTFGTLIKKWEMEEPIPEPASEWKDVDGIVRYISVWFLGHLCKMIGIKNTWSALYEEEIAKYTVNMPEYNEDDDINFEDVFGAYANENTSPLSTSLSKDEEVSDGEDNG